MRLVVSDPKTGKSYQKDLPKEMEVNIVGKKIRDEIDGNLVGIPGYMLQLTGGSDSSGFPMRTDISGQRKIRALLSDGIGFKPNSSGERRRKLIRGNIYSIDIMQVNAKLVSGQGQSLEQIFPATKKEEKK